MKKLKKAQVGTLIKGLVKSAIRGTEKAAVKKAPKMLTLAEKVEAKKFAQTPAEKIIGKDADKVLKRLNINKYNETPPPAFKLTAEQKANNDKILKNANNNMKSGGMIKRADGSMSKRGLWDNIRANKGSGKKPTSEMLNQEKKIKAKKAEGGVTLAKNPDTDPKNALSFTTTKENKNLSDVTKRETAGEALKGFYKKDYLGADKPGRTKAGKTLRKIGNTAIKAAFTPQAVMATGLRAGSTAKGNKAELANRKMGGKVMMKTKNK